MRSFVSIVILSFCNSALVASEGSLQQEQDYTAAVLSKWSYSKEEGASLKGFEARWMWGDAGRLWGHKIAKQDPLRVRWSKWLKPEDAIANINTYNKDKDVDRPVNVQVKNLVGDEINYAIDTTVSNIAEAIDEIQKWKSLAPCDYKECAEIPNSQGVCCPQGQTKYADVCRGGERQTCVLYGSGSFPPCSCKAWTRSGGSPRDGEKDSDVIIWVPEIDDADKVQVLQDFPPMSDQGMNSGITFVLVEKEMRKTLYVVFKGADQIADLLDDMNMKDNQVDYRSIHGVGIHNGFHQEVRNRWEWFKDEMHDEFKNSLKQTLSDGSVTDIIITGHAMGGAHATALYAMLSSDNYIKDYSEPLSTLTLLKGAQLVTFGSPMVFTSILQPGKKQPVQVSSDFVDIMQKGRNYIFRNDPVPRMYKLLNKFDRDHFSEVASVGRFQKYVLDMIAKDPRFAIVGDSIERYAQYAGRYKHFQKIMLLGDDSKTGNWEIFDFKMDNFKDHNIDNYVDAFHGPTQEFTHTEL